MRTIITLDGKKINKNAACEMFGKEDMDKRIKKAKEVFSKTQMKNAAGGWKSGC